MNDKRQRSGMTIPYAQLPEGFVETIGNVPEVVPEAHPAATAVLMRNAGDGVEVLLLRRSRTAGFVPGAYVFPGGRVDEADADPAVFVNVPDPPTEPAPEFWAAALREVFEETGVLLASNEAGETAPDAISDPALEEARVAMLDNRISLRELLEQWKLRPAVERMVYAAHWITPVVEPRRFDARFFLAALPPGRETTFEPREMSDAIWLSPSAALDRFEDGSLPMIFPTVRTLESISGFDTVESAFSAFRQRTIRPFLPRLVRTAEGVSLILDEDTHAGDAC